MVSSLVGMFEARSSSRKRKERRVISSSPPEIKKLKTEEKKGENEVKTTKEFDMVSTDNDEEDFTKEKVLKILVQFDGLKKIGDVWLS